MPHAILSAIGGDRPGLVDEVSRFIFEHGGNIEESRMVNLRGQFAVMVLVAGEESVLDALRRQVGRLADSSGLHASLQPLQNASPALASEAVPYRLIATAIDQPGLLHRVSHVFQQMQVNIENLDTHLTPAPYTGAPLFEMELILAIPRSVQLSQLRQKLASVCEEMNIDWELRPA